MFLLNRTAHFAWSRIPFRSVRLAFKMRADNKRFSEILWVLNNRKYCEPLGSIIGVAIEIFCENRVFAIRHTIGPEISRLQPGCYYFQITVRLLPALRLYFPRRSGVTLKARLLSCWNGAGEVQQPLLLADIGLNLQCVVILPGDMYPQWQPHECRGAVRIALVA